MKIRAKCLIEKIIDMVLDRGEKIIELKIGQSAIGHLLMVAGSGVLVVHPLESQVLSLFPIQPLH